MKYRVSCDLFFENEGKARGLFNHIKGVYREAVSSNDRERKRVNIHKCFHDEAVSKPCETIEEMADAESNGPVVLS